ncbi:glycosyltransferase [Rhizorhabdus histidinilytica]|uniref:glycosyltransferase n=1 Tax=Rhizorhabdus histidinilytica TaxID=439228 RepID=UPI002E2BD256|nr:glycosyltransferase [Rhizorhabdus histidinilytica]
MQTLMLWTVAAPFFTGGGEGDRWLDDLVDAPAHRFLKIPAAPSHGGDWHRRATRATPVGQWLRHWRQSARALDRGEGVVTVFPQLALTAAIQRRIGRRDTPIVAWCFNVGRFPTGWKQRLASFLLRSIDMFVVHSRGEVALLRDRLMIDEARVCFVPLQRAAIPVLAEEQTEAPFALAMGSANRDYATLYEACRRTGLPLALVAARRALPAEQPPPNVTLHANLDPVACLRLAQQARLSIVPLADVAAASGQITMVEAMRMGRPLIVTDTIGSRDYVVDDATGLLVPPRDPAALAAAMQRLWDDAALRSRLSSGARRFAEDNLSDEAAAAALVRILDAVATRRQG